MRGVLCWGVVVGLALPGCTLAFDAGDYPGVKDAPVIAVEIVDPSTGAVVGVVPPDNADGVDDQPARTVHDLKLRIDEALNGRGEPIEQFRVEWEKSVSTEEGQLIAETIATAQITSDMTAKDQTWQVTVTPVVGDREGPPATVSVPIENSPPVIGALGLSSYTPMGGDSMQAFASKLFDEDGDPVLVRYRWYLGDEKSATTLLDESSSRLVIPTDHTGTTFLHVEAEAADIEGLTTTGTIGPLEVLPRQTLWRPLRPDTMWEVTGAPFLLAPDVVNRRAVLFKGSRLWEFRLDLPHRWVELTPSGDPPPTSGFLNWVLDPDSRRVIVFGGSDSIDGHTPMQDVYVLHLERGNERWTKLPRSGGTVESPSVVGSTAVFDGVRSRVLVFGTRVNSANYTDEVWALKLDGDDHEWQQLQTEDPPKPRLGAMAAFDPNRDQAFLIGGFESGQSVTASQQVWRVTFPDDQTVRFEWAFSANQPPLGSAAVAVVPSQAKVRLLGGLRDPVTPSRKLYEMSLSGELMWEELAVLGDELPDVRAGSLAAFEDGGYAVLSNRAPEFLPNATASIDIGWLEDDNYRSLETLETTYPPHIEGPSAFTQRQGLSTSGLVVLSSSGETDHFWRFSALSDTWERIAVEPDPDHGLPVGMDGIGYGYSWQQGHTGIGLIDESSFLWSLESQQFGALRWERSLQFEGEPSHVVGGTNRNLVLGDTGASIERFSSQWVEVRDAIPLLGTAAAQAVYERGVVGRSRHVVLFGGATGGNLSQDLHVIDRADLANPRWITLPPDSPEDTPSGRFDHTMAVQGGTCGRANGSSPWEVQSPAAIYLFGGNASQALDDTWVLRHVATECDDLEWAWEPIDRGSAEGPPMPLGRPLPRWRHVSAWDRGRSRLIVAGGLRTVPSLFEFPLLGNEVWELIVVEEEE